MKIFIQILIKALILVGLISILGLSWSESKWMESSFIDVRAALLVFVAPIFVLILFQKESILWGQIFRRLRQTSQLSHRELMEDLEKNTALARGQYGYSHLLKMTESHIDSTVKYAGEMVSARFNSEELAQLLLHRIQAEDAQWQAVYSSFGFLAKMAPYFGMMATVIGMVKLLENMSDFSHISANMALAMQGTLYGLVSFLLFYSPMQRFFQDLRSQMMRRNEMVMQWFIFITEQADPTFIQKELRSNLLTSDSSQKSEKADSVVSVRSAT